VRCPDASREFTDDGHGKSQHWKFQWEKNICNWRIFETCLIQRVLLSNQQPAAFFVAKLLQRRMNFQ
jgi:hypothetical protein